MEQLDPRSSEILRAVVQGFIETGEPVSSEWLYSNFDFGIKPAMIRLELNDLTERGFLEQPHHAAGRVPSDTGYEFFANQTLEETKSAYDRQISHLFENHAWPALLSQLSEELGVLGVAATSRKDIFKSPLENLVDALDWNSREEIKMLLRDFEELDERMAKAWKALDDDSLRVFVGKKSPITQSGFLSVMAGEYDADGGRVLLCAIGPKRMDYGKTAKIMKGLKETKKSKRTEKK